MRLQVAMKARLHAMQFILLVLGIVCAGVLIIQNKTGSSVYLQTKDSVQVASTGGNLSPAQLPFVAHQISQASAASISSSDRQSSGSSRTINTPDHIAEALKRPDQRPSLEVLQMLKSDDQDLLIELFNAEESLSNKHAISWMLAWLGGEKVVQVFTNALFKSYSEERLEAIAHQGEDRAFHTWLFLLGFLAAENDSAFKILQSGIDPDYWRKNAPWLADLEMSPFMLIGHSIQAIGISGHPEAAILINNLKTHEFRDEPESPITAANLSGAVVDAAFYIDMIREHGLDFVRTRLFGGHDSFKLFLEWQAGPQGQAWVQWSEKLRHGQSLKRDASKGGSR
jgi:hypothetical protein